MPGYDRCMAFKPAAQPGEIREQITVRVLRDTRTWLDQLTAGTPFSVNQIAATMLDRARRKDWRIAATPSGQVVVHTPNDTELGDLSLQLCAIEEWLRESETRHTDEMADVIDRAWQIIDDLYDAAAPPQTSGPGTPTPLSGAGPTPEQADILRRFAPPAPTNPPGR